MVKLINGDEYSPKGETKGWVRRAAKPLGFLQQFQWITKNYRTKPKDSWKVRLLSSVWIFAFRFPPLSCCSHNFFFSWKDCRKLLPNRYPIEKTITNNHHWLYVNYSFHLILVVYSIYYLVNISCHELGNHNVLKSIST